ncbi:MAG: DUF188 domain-containing protein [Spirochaetaceae bacterium]|jgi:uncharacterized protein YaiI (UPF0178 family)|nr:DUF188 domain-containing protein [Spirochaetaceae bacterium]
MTIYVDADSCPRPARELVVRTAKRRPVKAVFAANRPIPLETGPGIVMEICPPGEGSADNRIVELARAGDLVITRDVPLASRLVEKSIPVIDDRGRAFTRDNIRERLSLRDFTVGLAEHGLGIERIVSYGRKELKSFADSLDRELRRLLG